MRSLRFRTPFSGAALAVAAFLALPAGTPAWAYEPVCSAVGTTGPDLRPIDADSTLGPWLTGSAAPLPDPQISIGGPPRMVALSDFVRSPSPQPEMVGLTVDLLRRRLDAVRGALDEVERQLSRIETTLRRLEEASGHGPVEAALPVDREAAFTGPRAGRDRFDAGPIAADLADFGDLVAIGPAVLAHDSLPPLIDDQMGPPAPAVAAAPQPAAAASSGWTPSARLVELVLQSAAIAFLATVLLVPFGCWLTSSAMQRRARRREAVA